VNTPHAPTLARGRTNVLPTPPNKAVGVWVCHAWRASPNSVSTLPKRGSLALGSLSHCAVGGRLVASSPPRLHDGRRSDRGDRAGVGTDSLRLAQHCRSAGRTVR